MKLAHITLATLVVAATSCQSNPPPELPSSHIAEAPASEIESVIYLVGDVGDAIWERSPLPHRLAAEVEAWSGRLARDSAVAVIFLGDNSYPKGLRMEPLYFAADSAHLQAQADVFAGRNARAYKAFGLFIAGNHDWGHMPGNAGEARLRNQEQFFARRRAQGVRVELMPKAGAPGPGAVNVGRRIKILLLDTAWWLLSADREEKARTMGRLTQLMVAARQEGRAIIMVAHHPLKSASVHGGMISLTSAFGIKWFLYKSGAALQDLNSLPYRDFRDQLAAAFAPAGPPLIFAGGHDHSLQIMRAVDDKEPRYMLVSGAGSKSSNVGRKEGMLYRSSEPGFMRLIIKKDGGVDLFVFTAPTEYLMCPPGTPVEEQTCISKGTAEFQSRYSLTLR